MKDILERIEKKVDVIDERVYKIAQRVSKVEVKAALFGALGGMVIGIILKGALG